MIHPNASAATSFVVTGAQSLALILALRDFVTGAPVYFTAQPNGELVVAFDTATVTITPDGRSEES